MFAAQNPGKNRFKDYETIEQAIRRLDASAWGDSPVLFIALGSDAPGEQQTSQVQIRHIPFITDPVQVARYFQAADIYLHAAHADNFPFTVLEALACGTPVVATAVGGIPEQIDEGVTGFLTPPGDSAIMAARIATLLSDDDLRIRMGSQAAEYARRHFDLNRQADEYLGWYEEILERSHV